MKVIIPMKSARVKSRLSAVLSEERRAEFSRVLLSDLFGVLRGAGVLRFSQVVSSDRKTLDFAARSGANPVPEDKDAGVNSAVKRVLATIAGNESILVLPSDLALLRPSELLRLLQLKSAGLDIVLAPSRSFNGTNALLFSSGSDFPLSYDDDSFWNHLAACGRLGLSAGVCCERGLLFDVDTPDDLRLLAASRSKRRSVAFARVALR
jgi:2-phospho-L-lactate/phosphoenolpyruvate guanylyltransferase